jgi:DNA topoisomerase-1
MVSLKGGGRRPRPIEPLWTTLSHPGVTFPPPYVPSGAPVTLRATGGGERRSWRLSAEAEEFAVLLLRLRARASLSRRALDNFWSDWSAMLPPDLVAAAAAAAKGGGKGELEALDLSRVAAAAATKGGQEEGVKAAAVMATVDGRLQPVGGAAVAEGAGIFMGRGDGRHPLAGRLKRRMHPGDVTLNLGPGARVPPGRWAAVVHDPRAEWLATWHDPLLGTRKYTYLAAAATRQQQLDRLKFDAAARLAARLADVRREYGAELDSASDAVRQVATCLWMLDWLALRVGSPTTGGAAPRTFGASTLLAKHVTVRGGRAPLTLTLDFPGKDGVRYLRTLTGKEHDTRALRNLAAFAAARRTHDAQLFDPSAVSRATVGARLERLMPGLTAKVMRTCRAGEEMRTSLARLRKRKGGERKDNRAALLVHMLANARVACLCNHRRNLGAGSSGLDASVVASSLEAALDHAVASPVSPADVSAARRLIRDAGLALSTSSTNYLDPRITTAFCAAHDVPQERLFSSAALRRRFAWALGDA